MCASTSLARDTSVDVPDPVSKIGVHSSSSSALHPEPAPENTRSSITPGKPEAGVCKVHQFQTFRAQNHEIIHRNSHTTVNLLDVHVFLAVHCVIF